MLFRFENINYSLGNEFRQVTVSGAIDKGNLIVLQGKSGAGKSSLMRVVSKLQPLNYGECYLDDKNWSAFSNNVWRRSVHYLFQRPVLFEGNVRENLKSPFEIKLLSKESLDISLAKDLLNRLLLSESVLDQHVKTLSGGEAAKIAFVRSLLLNPSILLLDEPTASFDAKSTQAFYNVLTDWLKEPQHGVMLISHQEDYRAIKNHDILKLQE